MPTFGTVVNSLVKNVLTPITGIVGTPDFSLLVIHLGKGAIRYGTFINDLLSFLIIAVAVFFFLMRPVNRLMAYGTPSVRWLRPGIAQSA